MKKSNVITILSIFFIIVSVFVTPTLFHNQPADEFIAYRSDVGIDKSQQSFVRFKLGLKEKFSDDKKYDEDYVNILALNDEKVLSIIAKKCAIPNELAPLNRKITIRRQKSFGYFHISFTHGAQPYSECIVKQFNLFLVSELLAKYSDIASGLKANAIENQSHGIRTFLENNKEYYKILSHILASSKEVYRFEKLSEHHEDDTSVINRLKFYLALNISLAFVFFRLFLKRSESCE